MKSVSEFRSTATHELPSARLGRGVGWMSLGLAAAQLIAPHALLRLIGIGPSRRAAAVVRLLGVTKLGVGLGVLLAPRRPLPLAVRTAHDVIDLGLAGLAGRNLSSSRRLAGALAIGGVGVLNGVAARRAQKTFGGEAPTVMYAVTINKPPAEVYAFFRRFERLPSFMDYLEEVRELDDRRSRWVARLPGGRPITWEARIVDDIPGELIAWEALEGSRLDTRGRITFARAPGSDLTEVRVEMQLGPRGHASSLLAKAFAKPELKGDLRRLKQVLETGEVLVSDASAHTGKHPAQPDPEGLHLRDVFIPTVPRAEKGVMP